VIFRGDFFVVFFTMPIRAEERLSVLKSVICVHVSCICAVY